MLRAMVFVADEVTAVKTLNPCFAFLRKDLFIYLFREKMQERASWGRRGEAGGAENLRQTP